MDDDLNSDDEILMFITESGFKMVPIQTIIDALAAMEDRIKEETNTTQEELDNYLERIENLVGKEEALNMEVDDIIRWIKAFKSAKTD